MVRTAPDRTLTSTLRALVDGRPGPLGLLELLEPLRGAVDDYERKLVIAARKEGKSWDEIGEALGVPRQTAHRRHAEADPRGGERVR